MARVLGVSKAGYHAWVHLPPSAHTVADEALLKRVRTVHATSRQTYGAPRVHSDLQAQGEHHGRKRVARLMRLAGLIGASHRHGGPTTTRRDKEARPAPDLVDRDFTVSGPHQLWVADITYVPTLAGFLYLAIVLNARSRLIVVWSMANHLRAELMLDAIEVAVDSVGRRTSSAIATRAANIRPWRSARAVAVRRTAPNGVRPSMDLVDDGYGSVMAEASSQRWKLSC
jgi:putative transposase